MKQSEFLKDAMQRIEKFGNWTTVAFARTAEGAACSTKSFAAVKFCASGSLLVSAKKYNDIECMRDCEDVLREIIRPRGFNSITWFNDVFRTPEKHQEVLIVFRDAIAYFEARGL